MLKPNMPRRSAFAILLLSLLLCGLGISRAQTEVVSQNRFTAPDAWEMGNAMAASGNTLVVGDQYWNNNLSRTTFGNAYVFMLANGQWTQTGELMAADGQPYDLFGSSVAISGSTIVVGAALHNGTGAAYVFGLNNQGQWVQQQEILPADGVAGDHFGCAVALSGTTLAVGACQTQQGGVGSVYTYALTAGTWQPQAEWAHPNPTTGSSNFFGAALSLAGTTLLIGAPGTSNGYGAAYLYTFNGSAWTLTASLTAADATRPARFGYSVVTDGSVAIVGAPNRNRAYAYLANGGAWSLQTEIAPLESVHVKEFGYALALSAGTLVVSALNAAEVGADVFTQSKNGWVGAAELAPSDHTAAYRQSNDQFGTAVAVVGSTIVVSRPVAWYGAIAPWAPLGEIYSYAISGAEVTAPNRLNGDSYGYATAVSGTTYAAGIPGYEDSTGAVTTYTRTSNSILKSIGRLTAPDGQVGDGFGAALAFNGSTLVVGAPYANNVTGSIYVYTVSSGVWTLQAELIANDGQPGDMFGFAVGSPNGNSGAGAAYTFTQNAGQWIAQAELTAFDVAGSPGDQFGAALALSGTTLVVGDYGKDTFSGEAYVFALGNNLWSLSTTLTSADQDPLDEFGASVAISGGSIAIGAPNTANGEGSLYAF